LHEQCELIRSHLLTQFWMSANGAHTNVWNSHWVVLCLKLKYW